MSSVRLEGIAKRFGPTEVIKQVDLAIESGEFVVFVGASGSGKSTLLRMIAGLEQPSEGTIRIGNRDVTDAPPSERGVSMVFQSYALYPHMTVRENIAFGLKLKRIGKTATEEAVQRAATMLEIEALLDRKPGQLSGGQRQRVAIARAIVREPDVFLFDEPLSNLDAALRTRTRMEIRQLHKSLGATMIYVTHDQVEAMSLADRMVILHDGHIEQVGPPAELYHRPATAYVAGFLGMPTMNFLAVERVEGGDAVLSGGERIALPSGAKPSQIAIRPEDLEIANEGLPATLTGIEELGETRIVHAELADKTAIAIRSSGYSGSEGDKLSVRVPTDRLHLFDASGKRL
ncbi:ABC transporter ATP-binding protein [Croceicoccus naphthovorans]|uniref:ABC transporter ATP-binding protein n=1 Tax=Croceicoccus naphthovorans TaxID=1348774 RepID=A0A0G3XET7_9SPHN|nr:sn-glycerol-3-phosphate ABC transporter ATP-binding protein UgpC [Croceicoccus naphthovorans]AKM08908.1 ABC transporter ATP-binding protein [Croceicoccus naphthovorans]MBB3989320.1 ABC-type sugar transport system ATPase subunit [Croceicoccus naphthovorans]